MLDFLCSAAASKGICLEFVAEDDLYVMNVLDDECLVYHSLDEVVEELTARKVII